MGQTCLRSPCCPGTLFPGCLHPSLAGVEIWPGYHLTIQYPFFVYRKQLILETALMRPLDRVASMAVLTATGVENVFKFDRTKAPAMRTGQTRVYLISANLIMAKLVADQVSEAATGSNDKVIICSKHGIIFIRMCSSIGCNRYTSYFCHATWR